MSPDINLIVLPLHGSASDSGEGLFSFSLNLPLALFVCSSALKEERVRKMKSPENSLQGTRGPALPNLRT